MASKRRNMSEKNTERETTKIVFIKPAKKKTEVLRQTVIPSTKSTATALKAGQNVSNILTQCCTIGFLFIPIASTLSEYPPVGKRRRFRSGHVLTGVSAGALQDLSGMSINIALKMKLALASKRLPQIRGGNVNAHSAQGLGGVPLLTPSTHGQTKNPLTNVKQVVKVYDICLISNIKP
ncbi:hypothetical protein AAG570_001617 [Ranatra chinensis]|uniref:Uncharacterized protein n=1 Tax=Ranatra chinensis TaxID=642074 RepID=A0ABD0Y9B5_9HEMI